jgi:minor histocompatibility antigen H13
MADVEDPIVEDHLEDVEDDVDEPAPVPIPLQHILTAYVALLVMALIPIWFGSKRALAARIKRLKDKEEGKTGDDLDDIEVISSKDAAKFPIMASITLFSIYMCYKFFADKMYYIVTGYFFILGVVAVTAIFEPIIAPKLKCIFPGLHEDAEYQLTFWENKKQQFDLKFNRRSLVVAAAAVACAMGYLYNKHWLANNIIGLCFAVQGVELLSLPNYKTGAMLLGGLFFYDVFWVFGTDVMVTVAKKFDAPIKLVFPQNVFDTASKSSMLGLGDIVIPGILIALMLRVDNHLKPGSQKYFITTFIAYIIGLVATIFVMHVWKHAQPALLYLVPACLGAPLLMALISGDIKSFFEYDEEEQDEELSEAEVEKLINEEDKKDN